jgi:phytanoyl-CoA hydroxylase
MEPLADLREKFDADGFVIVRDYLGSAEVAEVQAQLARYIKEVIPTLPKDAAFFDDYSKEETLRQMESLEKYDPWFLDFMNRGKHVPLMESFLRDGLNPQGLEWFDKLPYDQKATPPHQDGFYWCRKPNSACRLWIALDPVGLENGCLWYSRGSHLKGIRPHQPSGKLGFSQGIGDFDPNVEDAVPIELNVGDAVCHHSATVHWTGVNTTSRHRRALTTVSYGASTVRDEEAFSRYLASMKSQLAARGIQPGNESARK